jgi:hypothetical protein
MKNKQTSLPKKAAELKKILLDKDQEINRLQEEIRLLRLALFAPKSEKRKDNEPSPQLSLFDMPENPQGVDGQDEEA